MKDWMKIPLGIVLGLALAGLVFLVTSQPRGESILITPAPTASLFIQISGEVTNPGLYQLPVGSRVEDAVTAAGGFLPSAIADNLNLARPVKDGEAIHINGKGEYSGNETRQSDPLPIAININTATMSELDSLPGIGQTRAQAILDYRTDHGGFVTIEELLQVPSITQDVYSKIKDLITVE